jgi:hypothetical protein
MPEQKVKRIKAKKDEHPCDGKCPYHIYRLDIEPMGADWCTRFDKYVGGKPYSRLDECDIKEEKHD